MKKNYETALPQNYKEAFHIDARSKKVGLVMNLLSFIPLIGVIILVVFTADINLSEFRDASPSQLLWVALFCVVLMLSIVAYMILHELVHGVVYKAMTKQKLKFGLSWSCAFCGVPDVYTYRKTAFLALIAPFAVFGVLFAALAVVFYFFNPVLYVLFAFLFGMHVGGCVGDLYMTGLLLFKYKDKKILMRDTGPEQWIYVPTAVTENTAETENESPKMG